MNTGSRKFGPLCIEGKVSNSKGRVLRLKNYDPLNETNDVGRSTYHWNQVRQCFDQCCRKLKKALEDQPDPAMRGGTLLGQILQVHHDLLLYR